MERLWAKLVLNLHTPFQVFVISTIVRLDPIYFYIISDAYQNPLIILITVLFRTLLKAVNYFRKKLYLRCLAEIRLFISQCSKKSLIPSRHRSTHPEVFFKKGILKICGKFTGEHPRWSLISIKLRSNTSS